jgi:hypothetical protein
MSEELFTQMLRENIYRKPFQPFCVELQDGKRIIVDYPSVAIAGPSAAFLGENEVATFDCDQVKTIFLAVPEVRA